jgi:hypothetical protein
MAQTVLLSKKGATQAQIATALGDPSSAVGQQVAVVADQAVARAALPAPVLVDSFIDTAGTGLGIHLPDTFPGSAWSTSVYQIVQGGAASSSAASSSLAMIDVNTDDVVAQASFLASDTKSIGVVVRGSASDEWWLFWINASPTAPSFRVYQQVSGQSLSQKQAETIAPLVAGEAHTITVRVWSDMAYVTLTDADGERLYEVLWEGVSTDGTRTQVGLRGTATVTAFTVHPYTFPATPPIPTMTATNAANPLTLPTYNGDTQGTHPDVIDFGTAWNGYRYWMAYTPHTNGNSIYENPTIVASTDGTTWVAPAGISNPITPAPSDWPAHLNTDTDLVYQNGTLYCFYRVADTAGDDVIVVKTSTNGVTWSVAQEVFRAPQNTALSPAFIVEDDGSWSCWVVDSRVLPMNRIYRRTAPGPMGPWSEPEMCMIPRVAGKDIWHLNVFRRSKVYYGLWTEGDQGTNATNGQLWIGTSVDGIHWATAGSALLAPSTGPKWDDTRLYRSAMVPTATGWDIWYAGIDAGGAWRIGKTAVTVTL